VKLTDSRDRDREHESGSPRRRSEDRGILQRFPKWLLVTLLGVSWSGLLAVGGIALYGAQRWGAGLEAAVKQANVDAQAAVLERLTRNEAEVRAIQANDVRRDEDNRRRDQQFYELVQSMNKLTNRLDVYIALDNKRSKGGSQ
jgi:hypothetical protein